MLKVLSSSSEKFLVDGSIAIGFSLSGEAKKLAYTRSLFKVEIVDFSQVISSRKLSEEAMKSFVGSAGLSLVGGTLLGPAGFLAGALAGGNKKSAVFTIVFLHENKEVKLIVETSSQADIKALTKKEMSCEQSQ